jgi:hypothetical protein
MNEYEAEYVFGLVGLVACYVLLGLAMGGVL